MDIANRAVLERRSFWQDPLAPWQRRGMTQVAYCRQQGVNLAQCRYCQKRLLSTGAPNTAPGFIALQMASVGATVAVVLSERRRVEVQPGFDPATRRAVVQALGGDVAA